MEESNLHDKKQLVHSFNNRPANLSKNLFLFLVGAIVVGVLTGYLLGKNGGTAGGSTAKITLNNAGNAARGTVIGSSDTTTFKDTVSGKLQSGGIDGEGQFHLVRPGGDSQNVYLTSSILDLSKFDGKKIKVWGQTQAAKHAGWLMDVGRVEVL